MPAESTRPAPNLDNVVVPFKDLAKSLGWVFLLLIGAFGTIAGLTWAKVDRISDRVQELALAQTKTEVVIQELVSVVRHQQEQLEKVDGRLARVENKLDQLLARKP